MPRYSGRKGRHPPGRREKPFTAAELAEIAAVANEPDTRRLPRHPKPKKPPRSALPNDGQQSCPQPAIIDDPLVFGARAPQGRRPTRLELAAMRAYKREWRRRHMSETPEQRAERRAAASRAQSIAAKIKRRQCELAAAEADFDATEEAVALAAEPWRQFPGLYPADFVRQPDGTYKLKGGTDANHVDE
jgi:hypothetical protein